MSSSNHEELRLLGATQRNNASIVQQREKLRDISRYFLNRIRHRILYGNGKSAATNGHSVATGAEDEKERFLNGNQPVRLTPAWEENNLTNDELNMKSMTMDRVKMELDPPKDRYRLILLTLVLHGLGTLIPWNMFITAKSYFVDYKLGEEYTGLKSNYAANFLAYLGFAAQIPNVLFNWLNIFIEVGGDLTTRIVWSIVAMVVIFIMTIVLAMVDSSNWPGAFFWITMITVVALNMANGIYQNTIYGIAAKLPFKYTGAVVLGSNISGCFTAVLSLISDVMFTGSARTAAIYYFITALFILLICFDTYFALPLNKFYRYHEMLQEKNAEQNRLTKKETKSRPPYWKIFKQAGPQLFNIFFIFFVTLSVFPTVHSDIKRNSDDFIIPAQFFVTITCFLTFNFFAMLGSLATSWCTWPKPKHLVYFALIRVVFIPLFLLCRYYPKDVDRVMPVYINSDWAYWIIAITMSFSSGYLSSLGMMYAPQSVEPQYASTAGMFGAAMLITGIFSGIMFSCLFPIVVGNLSW